MRTTATDSCYSPHLSYRTSSACAKQQRTRFGAALSCELRGVVEEHLRGKNDGEERARGRTLQGGASPSRVVHTDGCAPADRQRAPLCPFCTNAEEACAKQQRTLDSTPALRRVTDADTWLNACVSSTDACMHVPGRQGRQHLSQRESTHCNYWSYGRGVQHDIVSNGLESCG